MSIVDPEWIRAFFQNNEDFHIMDNDPNALYVDGYLSPQSLANFLNRRLASEIREPGEDWAPTAENINSLPRGMKDYIHGIETLSDPQWIIRENMLMKDTIRQLEAKILEAEK
jgi:hypothetical protein